MVTDVRLRAVSHSDQLTARFNENDGRFLRLADSAPVMVWVSGLDGGCTYFNRRWLDFTGRTLDQELGNGWSTGVHPDDLQRCLDIYTQAFAARREFSMEYRLRHRSGEFRWIWDTGAPVYDPDETFEGYVGSCVDMSKQKKSQEEAQRLQQELSHLARVSTMGELSASLAHELNQPLTAILTNAQVAQRLIAGGNPDLAELGEILADIVADDQRAGEVVHRVRSLIHKGKVEVQRLDLNGVVWDVVRLVRSEALIQDVSVILELNPLPMLIRGDRIQMQQVLLNLIINGLEAIKEAGSGDATLVVRTMQPDEHWVQVTVEDTGVGIARDALDGIFQPFHTSKDNGMGMGLSICRSIVQAHGGRIWAETSRERGAEFHMLLPVDSEP